MQDDDALDLIELYEESQTTYKGFILCGSRECLIELTVSNDRQRFHLNCEPFLAKLLAPHHSSLRNRWSETREVLPFLSELKSLINRLHNPYPPSSSLSSSLDLNSTSINLNSNFSHVSGETREWDPELYTNIIRDISRVSARGGGGGGGGGGSERELVKSDERLTNLVFRVSDTHHRSHTVCVFIPKGYPSTRPVCSAPLSLPTPIDLPWQSRNNDLNSALDHYVKALSELDGYYRALEDFDNNTWVLDPTPPNLAVYTRRVAMGTGGNFCSVVVSISPSHPTGVCGIRFLGPERVVGVLRERLNNNIHLWDHSLLPRHNLITVLELSEENGFRSRAEYTPEMVGQLECAICYSSLLSIPHNPNRSTDGDDGDDGKDGQSNSISTEQQQHSLNAVTLTEASCENPKCGRTFHRSCLRQWLSSLPSSSSHLHDVLQGACPYCSQTLTISF